MGKQGKHRSYCIVIHNVKSSCKTVVVEHCQGAKRSAIALEPYPKSDGFHIHIQIEYPNQRWFKSVLNEFIDLSRLIVDVKPVDCETDWGRVQVDPMKGTFEQATKYLVNPDKDKDVDPNVVVQEKSDRDFIMKQFMTVCGVLGNIHFFPDIGQMCTVSEYLNNPRRERNEYYESLLSRRDALFEQLVKN